MTNQIRNSNEESSKRWPETSPPGKTFDLEERTARFGEAIIRFAKRISVNPVTHSMIGQLVNAGTSIGANYGEANDAESKKDFRHKSGSAGKNPVRRGFGFEFPAPIACPSPLRFRENPPAEKSYLDLCPPIDFVDGPIMVWAEVR